MAYASGLSAQLMVAAESTVGTAVTVDTAYEFLSESLAFEPTFLDGEGLKAGQAYKRSARTSISRKSVSGDITLEHSDQGHMGLLWKHALGSSLTEPSQISSSTAYSQIHTPGSKAGFGLTVQVGRPQVSSATVQPFTYAGCKITEWELSCNDGEVVQFKMTLDGWTEATATALASASYTAGAGLFTFADATTCTLGGTASTSSGETTISSGTSVATVLKGFTLTGSTPMATDRYGLGNAGTKKEQIENDIPTITGHLDAEFTDRTEIYDVFKANTAKPFQLDFSHGDAGSSNPYLLSIIIPSLRFKAGAPQVGGPDIVQQGFDFEAYDDGTNPVIQIKLVSKDQEL